MAAEGIKSYAQHQLKRIENRVAKLDGKDAATEAKRARLASACLKWMRMVHRAR